MESRNALIALSLVGRGPENLPLIFAMMCRWKKDGDFATDSGTFMCGRSVMDVSIDKKNCQATLFLDSRDKHDFNNTNLVF